MTGLTANLGGGTNTPPRINLYTTFLGPGTLTASQADAIFRWRDDVLFVRPEEIKSNNATPAGSRPLGQYVQASGAVQVPGVDAGAVVTATPATQGNFSWFLTVGAVASEATLPVVQKRQYSVAVVVCSPRNFTGEQTCTGSRPDYRKPAYDCQRRGAVMLSNPSSGIVNVRREHLDYVVRRGRGYGYLVPRGQCRSRRVDADTVPRRSRLAWRHGGNGRHYRHRYRRLHHHGATQLIFGQRGKRSTILTQRRGRKGSDEQ